jgi:alkanesulfonate monooxygenase SsuD/methylene tetrahydromethanopterin reductase-like flavin-dependent oxidoreductase (luciferase family)
MGVIKDLAEGRPAQIGDAPVSIPWVRDGKLEIYMAAYGPRALVLAGEAADGLILQIGDPFVVRWAVGVARDAAAASGRDPASLKVCVAAPAYVGDDLRSQREQLRWFGGMVGNHVADIVERYGATSVTRQPSSSRTKLSTGSACSALWRPTSSG